MNKVELIEAHPEQLPGVMFFQCKRLSATLRPEECAARHREATSSTLGKWSACSTCCIGAHHVSKDKGRPITAFRQIACVRCDVRPTRLIAKMRCVSCHHRELEYRKGINARGTSPIHFRPLRPLRVGIQAADGSLSWVMVAACQTELEPVGTIVRQKPGAYLHGLDPGESVWNAVADRFEYRDRQGKTLTVDESADGTLTYRPAAPGERPAPTLAPTLVATVHFLATWLGVSTEGDSIDAAWRVQPFACQDCTQGTLQARRRAGRIECRCPACEAATP